MKSENTRKFEVCIDIEAQTMDIVMTGLPLGNIWAVARQLTDTVADMIAGVVSVQFGNPEFGRHVAELAKMKILSDREISSENLARFEDHEAQKIDPESRENPDPSSSEAAPDR